VGIIQSLLASCRFHHLYLVDVLQRIDIHPAFEVHLLTPRLWKQHFSETALHADLDHPVNNADNDRFLNEDTGSFVDGKRKLLSSLFNQRVKSFV
jgi:hypothetical protein